MSKMAQRVKGLPHKKLIPLYDPQNPGKGRMKESAKALPSELYTHTPLIYCIIIWHQNFNKSINDDERSEGVRAIYSFTQ